MKYLTATELEKRFDEIIAEVVEGETIIVTNDQTNKPIAKMVPSGILRKKQRVKIAEEIRKSFNGC